MSAFWREPVIGARSDIDNPPGMLERFEQFRNLEPDVDITSPRINELGVWQACWDTPGGTTLLTRKTCALLLDELREYFPDWEPEVRRRKPER